MRIVHLSYARVKDYADPQEWLTRINFFVALAEALAGHAEVFSLHCINYQGMVSRNGVHYIFLGCDVSTQLPFSKVHDRIREIQPDVIVVHGFHFPLQLLWLTNAVGKKIPIVVQHHAEMPLRNYKGILQPLVDRFVSAYFFTAREQAKRWVEKGQIRTMDKVHEVMEVPSVFQPIDKQAARQQLSLDADRKLYVWVGRIDQNKDPETLISGFIQFAQSRPNVTLYVIYRGDERIQYVNNLLDSCDQYVRDQIVLLGPIAHEEMRYWFSSCDFIISTSHYEGSGVAVCEGMSCGCIPITTDIASFRMMTQDARVGFLFRPGSAEFLREQLLQSAKLDIPTAREKVLDHYASYLSADTIAANMMIVFNKILNIS